MPGEGHSWRTRLLRWSVLGIGWSLYLFCRGCVIGQLKYDPRQRQLIIRARGILTKRLALLIKIFLLFSDYVGVLYILRAVFSLLGETEDRKRKGRRIFQSLVTLVGMALAYWNIGRLLYWLSSLGHNRSIVRVVNEVIRLHGLIERCFGPLIAADLHILIVFVAELHMTVLHLFNCLRFQMILFLYNIVLLEVFFSAYVAYQLLLLSWLSSFSRFLHGYHSGERPRLLRLFRLYARVSNGHQAIMELWLPVASMLFSSIVVMVVDCASIVNCILFKHNLNMRQKWDEVLNHLGGSLAPLLRMLLIGLCNDRLTRLENLLSLQLLGIDLGIVPGIEADQKKDPEQEKSFARQLRHLQICFDLQTQAQPIRNHIMSVHQTCGGPFVLEFFFCTLVNSFSCVQYVLNMDTQSENFQGFFYSH